MKARIFYFATIAFIVLGFSINSAFAQSTVQSSTKDKVKKTEATVKNKTTDAKTTANVNMKSESSKVKSDVNANEKKTTNVAATTKSDVKAKTHKMHKHMKKMKKESSKQKAEK